MKYIAKRIGVTGEYHKAFYDNAVKESLIYKKTRLSE